MIDSKGRIESARVLPLCALCGQEVSEFQVTPGIIHGFGLSYRSRLMIPDDVWFCPDCASRVSVVVRNAYSRIVQEIARENNMYKDGEE